MPEKQEAFIQWAKDNGIHLDREGQWGTWWACWSHGYDQGRVDQKAAQILIATENPARMV